MTIDHRGQAASMGVPWEGSYQQPLLPGLNKRCYEASGQIQPILTATAGFVSTQKNDWFCSLHTDVSYTKYYVESMVGPNSTFLPYSRQGLTFLAHKLVWLLPLSQGVCHFPESNLICEAFADSKERFDL